MKNQLLVVGFSIFVSLALSGCTEKQPSVDTTTPKSAENVGPAPTASSIAQTVTQAVVKVEKEAIAAQQSTNVPVPQVRVAQPEVQPAEGQAQSIIDRAKSLYADKKYQDALASLGGLANMKLTPDQQKIVDDLKTQVQSALAKTTTSDAASALGGVLGEKK